jgi:hypothetical protein
MKIEGTKMIQPSEWFSSQLSSSADGLAWAAEQIPAERLNKRPPKGLGEWPPARHIFHMLFYEQTIALPSMQQWLGEPMPVVQDGDEDKAWSSGERVEDMLLKFQEVRAQQIALLPKLDPSGWDRTCETVWGPATLFWVVAKTYQHTAEHISDVLRMALFWDIFAAREG